MKIAYINAKPDKLTEDQHRRATMTDEQIIALARFDLAYVAYCLKSIQRRLGDA